MVGLVPEPLPAGAIGLIGGPLIAGLGLPFSAAQTLDPSFRAPAGGSPLGLGYAVMLADRVLAPFTPSNSARSGGIVFPVVRAIPPLYGSLPGESARKIGADLLWTAFAARWVTSSLFPTAFAPNLLALEMGKKATGLEVSCVQCFAGFAPIGLPVLLAVPWLFLKIDPPEIRTSAEVPARGAQGLAKIGAVARRVRTMAALVVVALGLWIFGGRWIDATLGAPAAISLRVVDRVVTWDEIVAHTMAWRTFAWFATMLTLAAGAAIPGWR